MISSLFSPVQRVRAWFIGLTAASTLVLTPPTAQAAPPVYASSTTAVGDANPAVLTKPSGTAAGDLLVLTIISHRGSGSTFTAPSGWSNLPQVDNGTNLSMITFYRIADATDVAATSYSITVTGSTPQWSAGLSRITGVNTTTPINAYASLVDPTSGTSVGAPSITPTSPDSLVLSYHATNSNTTFTADATTTERFDSPNNGPGANDSSLMLATFTQATATATGAKTATAVTGGVRIGMQIAIAPPSTGTDTVSIAATTATAVEGGADGLYTFTRGSSTGNLTVSFQLDPSSTASAVSDFNLTSSSTLIFNPGNGAGTIVIPDGSLTATVALDALTETPNPAEAAETARLNVVAGSGYDVGASPNASVTITENSFLVTTTANSGTGSLRQAISNANAIAGTDTITFSDGTGGTINFTDDIPDTITLSGGQIAITTSVTIAGPGANLLTLQNTAAAASTSRVLALSATSSTVRLSGLTLTGGNCTTSGGALTVAGTGIVVDIIACAISGNSSTGYAGGIFQSSGTLTVVNSTISGNTSSGSGAGGGGIDSTGTALTLINSTLSGNSITASAAGNGGALWTRAATADIRNCTITNNTGVGGIGGVRRDAGTVTVYNSIIAGNVSNTTRPDVGGTFTSGGGNLIGNAGTATGFINGVISDQVGTGASPVNPQLAALANNGGPTQTHAFLTGSSAINAGRSAQLPADTFDLDGDTNTTEAIPVDQRGYGPRVTGSSVDIGAYERNALAPIAPEIAVYNGPTTASPELTDSQATVVDFGSTPQGTPVTRSFTIANPGTGVLSISSLTAPSGFTVLNAPTSINPGLSATFQVRFDAAAVTTVTGSVIITSNDTSEASFDFSISATATTPLVPEIAVSGNSVDITDGATTPSATDHTDFGSVNVTGGTVVRTFTIGNSGTAALNITGITAGGDFTVGGITLPATVNAASSTTFTVTFDPSATGLHTATVNIASNDSDENPFNFSIQGTGTDTVSIAATTATAVEGGADGLYTFTRGSNTGDLTVSFQLDPSSTASAVTDFDLTSSSTLTFNPGTGAGTIVIPNGSLTATVTLDALTETPNPAEAAETARLNVVAGSGYAVGTSPNASVTITANSFLVTTTADSGTGSLRQAITNANAIAGTDTITFSDGTGGTTNFTDSTPETITLASQISPASEMTIQGPGADKLTVSGGGLVRAFNVFTTSMVEFQDLTIANGAAVSGAGILVSITGGKLTLTRCVVTNCTSTGEGGGLLHTGGVGSTLTVTDCTISGNSTTSGVGASGIGSAALINTISRTTFSGNNSASSGGGFRDAGSGLSATFTNCTFSGNTATTVGGAAIRLQSANTLVMVNCTVTGNRATGGSGGAVHCNPGASVTLTNTLVADNYMGASPSTTRGDVTATIVSTSSNNLIGSSTGLTGITDGTNGNLIGTGASPLDPLLGSLANNGGLTQTHALLTGSPAINAGTTTGAPATDQRGYSPRSTGGAVDIGAYERNALPPNTPEIAVHDGATTSDPELTDGQATVVDFGSTPQGTPVTRSFTIANPGTGVLSLSSLTAPSGFTVLNAPGTIDPGLSATFQVRFDAAAVTTVTGSVTIASNDANEASFDFPVSATATTPVAPPFPLDGFPGAGGPGSVLLTGQQAPGLPVGSTFNYFGDLSLNEEGNVVLYGRATGPGITAANDAGLWILDGSGLNLMLREGDPAGVAGQTIAEPIRFGRITDTGITHVMTGVAGNGVTTANNTVGWVDDGTAFTPFYRRGTTFSNLFNGVSQHTAGQDGYVAAQLSLVTGSVTATNDTGITHVMTGVAGNGVTTANNTVGWVDDGTAFTPFYRRGTTFSNLFNGVSQHTAGQDGYVAAQLSLVTGSVTATNDTGIWKVSPTGSTSVAVREGQFVSGTASPNTIRVGNLMSRVVVSSTGWAAYPAYLTGVPATLVPTAQNRAVLKQNVGSGAPATIVAQSNRTTVPGVASARFNTFASESINAAGRVAFGATLVASLGGVTTTNDYGLWRETPSGLELVLREGQQVPGRAAGVVFNTVTYHRLLDNGGMVVQATLIGPGVVGGNNSGLWHIDPNGTFTLLLGGGQTLAGLGGSTMGSFYLRSDVSPSGKYVATINLVAGTGDSTAANNFAVVSGDAATPGVFDLTLRRGSQYIVGGSVRTIRSAIVAFFTASNNTNAGGGTGGLSRAITDDGRVTVWMQFTDNSSGPFITPAPVLP